MHRPNRLHCRSGGITFRAFDSVVLENARGRVVRLSRKVGEQSLKVCVRREQTPGGTMSGPMPSPKRKRLSLALADADRPDQAPDLIDYFSQRGGRVRELEEKCASLTEQNNTLRTDLEAAVAEVESIKVSLSRARGENVHRPISRKARNVSHSASRICTASKALVHCELQREAPCRRPQGYRRRQTRRWWNPTGRKGRPQRRRIGVRWRGLWTPQHD